MSLANFGNEYIDLVHLNFSENKLFQTRTINLFEHSSGVNVMLSVRICLVGSIFVVVLIVPIVCHKLLLRLFSTVSKFGPFCMSIFRVILSPFLSYVSVVDVLNWQFVR